MSADTTDDAGSAVLRLGEVERAGGDARPDYFVRLWVRYSDGLDGYLPALVGRGALETDALFAGAGLDWGTRRRLTIRRR